MYILAASDIIEQLENYPEIYLTISFYEIYCGKLYDLLNERELVKCMEDAQQRMNIMGLTEVPVDSVAKIMEIITNALQIRTSGKTGANDTSSRSHAIL
jgi:kinesin family protein 2/24